MGLSSDGGRGPHPQRDKPQRGFTGLPENPRPIGNSSSSPMRTVCWLHLRVRKYTRKIHLNLHLPFLFLFQGRAWFPDFLSGGMLETSFPPLPKTTFQAWQKLPQLFFCGLDASGVSAILGQGEGAMASLLSLHLSHPHAEFLGDPSLLQNPRLFQLDTSILCAATLTFLEPTCYCYF